MAIAEATELRTTGGIVSETGHPMHKILYAIRSRKITCVQRAGQIRLYSPGQVQEIDRIVRELNEKSGNRLIAN